MKNNDAVLIQRVLDGDDTAFSALVRKYQRSVHALAWRKIGDFHIAEDIAQDTFLKAYQRLSTLKEPQSFASWLYVITANHCKAWLRKNQRWTRSLEETSSAQLEKATYSGYIIAENERMTVETQREVVKKLLAKLQESDRTVITLYYLGGMTYGEISEFLGVSEAAIRNRLYRARRRLKKEEPMIREALGNFQITPSLTDNIMREISRLKPVAPSGGKPLVPWAIGVSTLAVILLMLGVGTQYLSRFQRPYSFDAASEMIVEIVEASIVLNLESKPDVRTQIGRTAASSKNDGSGQQPDGVLFPAAQTDGEDVPISKQQWVQTSEPGGIVVMALAAIPEGNLYTVDGMGDFYKLANNENRWQRIFNVGSLNTPWGGNPPIAKWDNTLYLVPSNELFASTDNGKTWNLLYSWHEGYRYPVELVPTDQAFYLAFDNGIFRSEDTGKTWQIIDDGLTGRIESFVKIQNTLFAGTKTGLYRLNTDSWQRLQFPVSEAETIQSVAATQERLYVAAQLDWGRLSRDDRQQISEGQRRSWWLFRSTDKGDSWTDITPTNAWAILGYPPHIRLVGKETVLLVIGMSDGVVVRSIDSGNTWSHKETTGISPTRFSVTEAVALNKSTFYAGGNRGIFRSTDGGISWHRFNRKMKSRVYNLITFRKMDKGGNMSTVLYARVSGELVKTTDHGRSWKTVQVKIPMKASQREEPPLIDEIVASGDVLYAKGKVPFEEVRLYRVSTDSNTLIPIQEVPVFYPAALIDKGFIEQFQENIHGAAQFFKQLAAPDVQWSGELLRGGLRGAFAVSGDIFYMEYNYKLFRWKQGETEWFDTGVEETAELSRDTIRQGFKLAASGNTVYVGKRDGHLVVSFDRGNNWIDLTPILPFSVKVFKEIVFAGPTVYVATDVGVTVSSDGKRWHAIADAAGTRLVMEKLAVGGNTLYGVSKAGVYRLESANGTWGQVAPKIADRVTSLVVDGGVLYVGTRSSGMLHFNLDE
ncbi:hypothetical protein C6499_17140 [Candidatus Poribacteria bacterium]|nr:MAG: hypothetical protein C6499_17140 [Candidatus Poribacteria bacterium]